MDPSAMDYEDVVEGLAKLLREGWRLEVWYSAKNHHVTLKHAPHLQAEGDEADLGDALAAAVAEATNVLVDEDSRRG